MLGRFSATAGNDVVYGDDGIDCVMDGVGGDIMYGGGGDDLMGAGLASQSDPDPDQVYGEDGATTYSAVPPTTSSAAAGDSIP